MEDAVEVLAVHAEDEAGYPRLEEPIAHYDSGLLGELKTSPECRFTLQLHLVAVLEEVHERKVSRAGSVCQPPKRP